MTVRSHGSAIEEWSEALARLFPVPDIEQPFDLGAAVFRAYEDGAVPSITIHLRQSKESARTYLGASGLGQTCGRKAWAEWRGLSSFDGRLLRLFRTGDVYEERMRAELRAVGFTVAGAQSRFTAFGGRVAGHCDDLIKIEHLPWALWEAKTANHRRTTELKKLLREKPAEALKIWDPKYWHQAHIYMAAFGVEVCLYEVTDKDTDDIVAFLLPLDRDALAESRDRAVAILDAPGVPARGYTRPMTPGCTRYCDHVEWCWHGAELPVACGTCVQWETCARRGEVCGEYQAVALDGAPVSEWEAL